MRCLIAGALALSLAACGGGGDSPAASSSSPPPPVSNAKLQMNATAFEVSAYAANLAPLPVTLNATIVNPPTSQLFYKISNSGKAVANSSFAWQSAQAGALTISFPSPGQLGVGTYQSSVQLSVCLDTACTQPIGDSPVSISVTYLVNAGSQPAASFTVQPGPTLIASPLFTSQSAPIVADFSFYVTNFPSSGLWVNITQPAGGPITSAAFVNDTGPNAVIGLQIKSPAALGPGIYSDSVSFTLCYDSACQNPVSGSPLTEPLDFVVSATAGIEYASKTIDLPGASSVAWDPIGQQLYATTISGGATPNSLVQLNPVDGTIGSALAFPAALTQLAISSDGQYAYVASTDQPTVYRVELASLTSDLQIPLGSSQNGTNTVYQLAVAPGAPQTLAVSLNVAGANDYTAGVAVFDGAIQRPDLLPPLNSFASPASIAWSDSASTLYAFRSAPANPAWLAEIDSVTANSSGLSVATAFPINLQNDALARIFYAAGRLYGNDAVVRDASTGAVLGQFAIPSGYQIITLLPDAGNSRVIFLTHNSQSSHLVLLCYDAATFAMTSLADLGYDNSPGYPLNMTLWGNNGTAFDYGGNSLVVLSGAFVASANSRLRNAHAREFGPLPVRRPIHLF